MINKLELAAKSSIVLDFVVGIVISGMYDKGTISTRGAWISMLLIYIVFFISFGYLYGIRKRA